jgi:hypothetical protein
LPWTAERARIRNRFEVYGAKIKALPGITYIDTTEPLLAVKNERPIFYKTDFHWNDPAAFVIAEKLVDTIAGLEHKPVPFWHQKLVIEERDFSGGQADFMPLFYPPHEQALFVRTNVPNYKTEPKREPFEALYTASGENLLPPVVVLGDSFFDGMLRCGIIDYFQGVARARIYHASVDKVLNAIPPETRYFILESIEVTLPYFRKIPLPSDNKQVSG